MTKLHENNLNFKKQLFFLLCQDYVNELEKLDNLTKTLSNQTDIIDSVDSWLGPFVTYVQVRLS